jgi:NADH-quinone oxidoreductase subunit C
MIKELKSLFSEGKITDKKKYFEIIINKENIFQTIKNLKENKNLFFNQLIDITAVDYPSNPLRFEIIYILLSMVLNKRVVVKTFLGESEGIESITTIHNSANWYERECYDLFGIKFLNHPDLRRIMTDYNFEGHPLRKDFPLTGHTEVRYDDLEKKVIYEPVKLTQEYRNFDYMSPWEGIPNSLAGDDKASEDSDE